MVWLEYSHLAWIGVFQNSIPLVAGIWAQHLCAGGRFYEVFDHVVFAILGDPTFQQFGQAFLGMNKTMTDSLRKAN